MKEARKIRVVQAVELDGVTVEPGEVRWIRADLMEKYVEEGKVELISMRSIMIPDDEEEVEA